MTTPEQYIYQQQTNSMTFGQYPGYPTKRVLPPGATNPSFTVTDFGREADRAVNSYIDASGLTTASKRAAADYVWSHAVSGHAASEQAVTLLNQVLTQLSSIQGTLSSDQTALLSAIHGISSGTVDPQQVAQDLVPLLEPAVRRDLAAALGRTVLVPPVINGRFDYTLDDRPFSYQARWQWQGLQADTTITPTLPELRQAGAQMLIAYANPTVYNPSETTGVRTCVAPATVQQSWILTDSSGKQITRSQNGGEYLLDPASTDYQQASVAFLVQKCQVQGWDGVILDEVDYTPTWWNGTRPAKYATDASWQSAMLGYVQAITTGLANAGLFTYINYGGPLTDPWAETVTQACTGTCAQYWVGVEGSNWTAPTASNGIWQQMLQWAIWNETNKKQSLFHCCTSSQTVAELGLATFLLATQGNGVYFAAVQDELDDIWTPAFDAALRLGVPLAPYTQNGTVYTRQFAFGSVSVDSSALTGTITLHQA